MERRDFRSIPAFGFAVDSAAARAIPSMRFGCSSARSMEYRNWCIRSLVTPGPTHLMPLTCALFKITRGAFRVTVVESFCAISLIATRNSPWEIRVNGVITTSFTSTGSIGGSTTRVNGPRRHSVQRISEATRRISMSSKLRLDLTRLMPRMEILTPGRSCSISSRMVWPTISFISESRAAIPTAQSIPPIPICSMWTT